MARLPFAVDVIGAASLLFAADGCGSPGAVEMAAGDAAVDASSTGACVSAGGRCEGAAACTAVGHQNCGSDAVCCFDNVCAPDANSRVIMASSYDQACLVDTDCAGVAEGNSCKPCDFNCTNAAINAGALPKYRLDTSNLPAVLAFGHGACVSSCGDGPEGPCCVGGKCEVGNQCASVPVLTCALGAACMATQPCMGGVAGCGSNCQCLDGKWQAPCPKDLPQTAATCTPEGAYCGYTTSTNACGADNCYCQGGAWNCEPTCIIPGDAAAESGADAAADGGTADARPE